MRDLNEGRRVTALDYEAFEALATAEGARIVDAALARHGAIAGRCVHRLGHLAVGDVAVWVGVAAPHRAEAFAACREIIDAIKHRLPIWKKEHYADGDSGWVNCEHAAGHGAADFDYSRQRALPEVGDAGQARLAAARVLVIGAGGLGCAVLASLAGAGVGELTIVDPDRVDASNLHRQPLYSIADIGRPKAEAAAARLAAYNPGLSLRPVTQRFDAALADGLVAAADVVVDCTDNFAAKFLVNDAAMRARVPAVLASVYQYEGQLQVVRADRGGSCLRCQWPEPTRDGLVGNCVEAGVLGPVPAVLGQMQAMEVLKLLLDLPGQLQDELILVDLLAQGVRRLSAPRNPGCAGRCVRIDAARGRRRRRRHAAARGRGCGRLPHRRHPRADGMRIRADARRGPRGRAARPPAGRRAAGRRGAALPARVRARRAQPGRRGIPARPRPCERLVAARRPRRPGRLRGFRPRTGRPGFPSASGRPRPSRRGAPRRAAGCAGSRTAPSRAWPGGSQGPGCLP